MTLRAIYESEHNLVCSWEYGEGLDMKPDERAAELASKPWIDRCSPAYSADKPYFLRQRHLKCDESRPICLRCQKSDRACRGYEAGTLLSSREIQPKLEFRGFKNVFSGDVPRPPSHEILPHTQLRALEYFHCNSLPSLTGFFQPQRWVSNVVYSAQTQPLLRHLLSAIGARHASVATHMSALQIPKRLSALSKCLKLRRRYLAVRVIEKI